MNIRTVLLTMTVAVTATSAFAQSNEPEAGTPAPVVTISLRDRASILGTTVQLGDIAAVEASYGPLRVRLESISLGRPPQAGFRRALDREQISSVLRERGLQPELVAWSGPKRCIVDSTKTPIGPDQILQVAEPAAMAALRSLGVAQPTLEALTVAKDVVTSPGRVGRSLHARVVPGSARRSILTILVEVHVDGVVEHTIEQQFRVFRNQEVLLPLRDIERGESLHDGLFLIEQMQVRLDDRAVYVVDGEIDGHVANRSIPRGRPIQQVDVRLPWLVRRNQPVEIIERSGAIEIRMPGVATSNGSLGEQITVRKRDGGVLRVYVAGAGTVSTRPIQVRPIQTRQVAVHRGDRSPNGVVR